MVDHIDEEEVNGKIICDVINLRSDSNKNDTGGRIESEHTEDRRIEENTDEDTNNANGVTEDKEIVISDGIKDEAHAAAELPDNR